MTILFGELVPFMLPYTIEVARAVQQIFAVQNARRAVSSAWSTELASATLASVDIERGTTLLRRHAKVIKPTAWRDCVTSLYLAEKFGISRNL